MNKTLLTTLMIAAQYAASASVSAVVGNLIAIKTPANVKPITKVSLALGTLIISGIASDMAMSYVETQIKEVVGTIVLTKEAIEEQMNQQEKPVEEQTKEEEG